MPRPRLARPRPMPLDPLEQEAAIAQVATEPWPATWVPEPALPRRFPGAGVRPPGFERAARRLRALGLRVVSAPIVFPIVVGIVSRIYSILLLALVPLFEPELHIPRLTGFREPFVQWDGQWYLTIANFGYHAAAMQSGGPNGGRHDFAFYPIWPSLIAGLQGLGIDGNIAATALANVIAVVALAVVFVAMRREFSLPTARWGVVLLAFSPAAYVLSMAYSEPLFLLLVGLYFAFPKFVLRPVLAGATVLTRVAGLAVAASAGIAWLRNWRDWRAFVSAVIVAVAFGAWYGYIWYLTGNPFGWFEGSPSWGHVLGLPAVYQAFYYWDTPRIGAFLLSAVLLGASILLARRNLELGLYCIVAIALSILGAPPESMARHALVAFPAFAFLADRLRPRTRRILLVAFLVLQANYVVLAFIGPWPLAP